MGNTPHIPLSMDVSAVHPHTHGEHTLAVLPSFTTTGSSPHAWGTLDRERNYHRYTRFIPTRMGNTQALRIKRRDKPVHPHTHGEHGISTLGANIFIGSSPHAWGTHSHLIHSNYLVRFIPTRMGNTQGGEALYPETPVHPHTHGEHPNLAIHCFNITGSSPHAWGTHHRWQVFAIRLRFIPTRMGNTRGCFPPGRGGAVHPHTHGEHMKLIRSRRMFIGSSPHAWGTQNLLFNPDEPDRFIPTRMGNTT